jgi:porin
MMPRGSRGFQRGTLRASAFSLALLWSVDFAVAADAVAEGSDDLWTRKTLLGDDFGPRPSLGQYGASFGLTDTNEILGNVSGGTHRGLIYEGLTDLNLTLDLRKHYNWRGVVFARAYQIRGRGLSANYLNNLDTVSSIEAARTTRLYELWYEQHIEDWLRIRVGQQSAGQEFLVTTTGRLFVNNTFSWPSLPSTDLPSGGPTYPLATPAVRFRVDASDALTFYTAFFNGNPVGAGTGNPQLRDASGTSFRVNDGLFAISEIRYNPENSSNTGGYRIGAWYNSERFPDQHVDSNGLSLASPASSGRPRQHNNDFSLYATIDLPLFGASATEGGLNVFARAMGAPADRNSVGWYVDGGASYRGILGRNYDSVGLAVAYARIGSAARARDADTAFFTGQSYPIRSGETALELTYQIQLAPWWQVQPDLEYVIAPGGGIPNPLAPVGRIRNALIGGVRSVVTF